jgi:uncharacterized membrane protein (UPF0136 family)
MNPGIIAAIAYGLLALIGGILAYRKVQSKASLISGAISGALLILGGILQLQGISFGSTLSLIVTAALIIVFGIRLAKTRKFMPAGLMIIAGIASLATLLMATLPA